MTATATARRYYSDKLNRLHDEAVAEGRAKGITEGRAEGKVEGLLVVLRSRGIEVPEDVETRIRADDDAQLDQWLQRAGTATSSADVFDH